MSGDRTLAPLVAPRSADPGEWDADLAELERELAARPAGRVNGPWPSRRTTPAVTVRPDEARGDDDGPDAIPWPESRAGDADQGRPSAEIVTVPLSDVRAETVDWIWRRWIPRGRLTLVAGHPSAGKSYLTQAIAAAVTTGAPLPGDDTRRDPADVILLALEDDPGDTLRPRLEAMGADLRRIHVYRCVVERRMGDDGRDVVEERPMTIPRDAGLLGDLIRRHAAAMVVVDPLVGVLDGAIDSHRQAAMRQVLAPLHLVAQETGAAMVVVAHLRKSAADLAMLRVGGSIDLVAAARSVIVVAPDPDDQSPTPSDRRRVAAVAKSNIAAYPEPVAYTLREGRYMWDAAPVAPGTTAETLLETPSAGSEGRGAMDEAMDYLRAALAAGPRPAREVQREARDAGIEERTLRRARERLRVRVTRRGFGAGGVWVWSLPIDDHAGAIDAIDDHTRDDGHLCDQMVTYDVPDAPPAEEEMDDTWLPVD